MFPLYTPWKHQKTKGFPVFSGVIKGNIGQKWVNKIKVTINNKNDETDNITDKI